MVNCGAIPAESIEAKLFGDADRQGLYEEADGGTVFLDEITQTTPSLQLELLAPYKQARSGALGANETQKVNVRVIAASSRNMEQEVAARTILTAIFSTT